MTYELILIAIGLTLICCVIYSRLVENREDTSYKPSIEYTFEEVTRVEHPSLRLGYSDSYRVEYRDPEVRVYRTEDGKLHRHASCPKAKIILDSPINYSPGLYTVNLLREGITFKGYLNDSRSMIIEF